VIDGHRLPLVERAESDVLPPARPFKGASARVNRGGSIGVLHQLSPERALTEPF